LNRFFRPINRRRGAGILCVRRVRTRPHLSGAIFFGRQWKRTMHWLAEFFRNPARIKSGFCERRGIDADLVPPPATEHRIHILDGFDSRPPTVSGMKALVGGAFNHVHHRRAAMRAGGDVGRKTISSAPLLVVAEARARRGRRHFFNSPASALPNWTPRVTWPVRERRGRG